MKNFFTRPTSKYYLTAYLPLIKQKFNSNNILRTPQSKVLSFFTIIDSQDFLAYRFSVLKEWMLKNEKFSKQYVQNLRYVIKNLCLENEFNSFEKQHLKNIEAIVFAKNRNLKQLIVDFPINKNELVLYRYEIESFNEMLAENQNHLFQNCDIYITNQRIIVSEHINTLSIKYDQIKNYQFTINKLFLNLANKKKYEIQSNDIPTIYVSLERVLEREHIFLNK